MLILILLFVSLLLFLYFPDLVISGAASGLLLWYQSLLPTLLPFMVLTSLILHTHTLERIPLCITAPFSALLRISPISVFAVLTGFLCGCPTGAKIIGDMVSSEQISTQEGQHLLSFCTHISPMFLIGFAYPLIPISLPLFIALIFGIPLAYGILSGQLQYKKMGTVFPFRESAPFQSSTAKTSYSLLIDQCLSESLCIIAKVGGYVMLCSVYITLLSQWKLFPKILLAVIEITNGISIISYEPFLIGLCSFGGLCMYMQIQSAIYDSGLSLIKCIKTKLCLAFISMLLYLIICMVF